MIDKREKQSLIVTRISLKNGIATSQAFRNNNNNNNFLCGSYDSIIRPYDSYHPRDSDQRANSDPVILSFSFSNFRNTLFH